MKKMFKAAASLAVGCALLSTSAFAAVTGTVTKDETGAVVALNGYTAKAQSTILVVKGDAELSAIPADLADGAIAYINQAEAADGTISYDVNVTGDATYTVFAGGSDQDAATKIGAFVISSVPEAPANVYISAADTDKATFTNVSGKLTFASTDVNMVEKVIELNAEAFPGAGAETAAYVLSIVDANDVAIENAHVFYSTERKKYVILVPETVTEYFVKVDDATETSFNDTFIYGDINGNGSIQGIDKTQLANYLKKNANVTTWKKALAADVNGNGSIQGIDKTQLAKALKDGSDLAITKK